MFGCVALAVNSIVALNACSGENGVDGKDVADGKDGVSVTDTVYVVLKDTVIFAGDSVYVAPKDTVFAKDTVILAGDTIIISKKDTVVVNSRDTVYIANGGSGSGSGEVGTGNVISSFGTLVDERDGQTYRTTKIGSQVWMAENLNVDLSGSVCYGNDDENCKKYGRLYTWDVAMKACPTGWHLPYSKEVDILLDNVGSKDNLRASNGWEGWEGTDSYGFSALPAGSEYNAFGCLGRSAQFWISREGESSSFVIWMDSGIASSCSISFPGGSKSVRCIQDFN